MSVNVNEKIKGFFSSYIEDYKKTPNLKKRCIVMMIGVFLMGFFLSFLINVNLGTDPYTFMNVTISDRISLSFGTWQLLLNIVLLVLVIRFNPKLIGPGTLANMILVGYVADFFRWVWSKCIPYGFFNDLPYRAIIFGMALLMFMIVAALYMNAEVGLAPYDSIPTIISDAIPKVPYFIIRIVFDYSVILVGFIVGGTPTIGVLIMAVAMGPIITAIGKVTKKLLG